MITFTHAFHQYGPNSIPSSEILPGLHSIGCCNTNANADTWTLTLRVYVTFIADNCRHFWTYISWEEERRNVPDDICELSLFGSFSCAENYFSPVRQLPLKPNINISIDLL